MKYAESSQSAMNYLGGVQVIEQPASKRVADGLLGRKALNAG